MSPPVNGQPLIALIPPTNGRITKRELVGQLKRIHIASRSTKILTTNVNILDREASYGISGEKRLPLTPSPQANDS
jgi:hypothetical protein